MYILLSKSAICNFIVQEYKTTQPTTTRLSPFPATSTSTVKWNLKETSSICKKVCKKFANLIKIMHSLIAKTIFFSLLGSLAIEGAVFSIYDSIFNVGAPPPLPLLPLPPVTVVQTGYPPSGATNLYIKQYQTNNYKSCTTARGKGGSCQKIHSCYPFLFPLNHAGRPSTKQTSNVNSELINILVEVSGICDVPWATKASIKQVLDEEFLVCCPDPDPFSLDPPPPIFPSEVGSSEDAVIIGGSGSGGIGTEAFKGQMKKSCGKVQGWTTTTPTTTTTPPPTLRIWGRNYTEENRVVGGKEAIPGEFPHMVGLLTRNKLFCGGSLIDPDWVLTAAHCVQHMGTSDIANLRLVFGDHDIHRPDVPIQTRTAARVLYHKGFTMKKLQNDIALIKLSSPVEMTGSISSVCLHDGTGFSIDGSTGDLAGWGQICEGCAQPSKLRKAALTILPHGDCVAAYRGVIDITDGMLCAGGTGMDSCRGDSGGGLTINSKTNPEHVGLVSFGVECGVVKPGVFTKTSAYIDWISRNLQRFRSPEPVIYRTQQKYSNPETVIEIRATSTA